MSSEQEVLWDGHTSVTAAFHQLTCAGRNASFLVMLLQFFSRFLPLLTRYFAHNHLTVSRTWTFEYRSYSLDHLHCLIISREEIALCLSFRQVRSASDLHLKPPLLPWPDIVVKNQASMRVFIRACLRNEHADSGHPYHPRRIASSDVARPTRVRESFRISCVLSGDLHVASTSVTRTSTHHCTVISAQSWSCSTGWAACRWPTAKAR